MVLCTKFFWSKIKIWVRDQSAVLIKINLFSHPKIPNEVVEWIWHDFHVLLSYLHFSSEIPTTQCTICSILHSWKNKWFKITQHFIHMNPNWIKCSLKKTLLSFQKKSKCKLFSVVAARNIVALERNLCRNDDSTCH